MDLSFPARVEGMSKEVNGDELSVHVGEPRSIPFVLSFHNLTYSVKMRSNMLIPTIKMGTHQNPVRMRMLLNDISGEARDGEILAVIGASGAGKTTLMDALANRIAKGSLKGTVTLNGEVLESPMLKAISAYVMQDDLLFPMLTVEETLMFAAEFRLPHTFPKSKKKMRVQTLIDQLGLRAAANTVIGDEGHRGVSGGERRRVSIGIDIIHDPIILLLDEPTSGLDSTNAFTVVKILQKIAESGSIVIMSIHQPSHRILRLLDRILILSQGKTVYSGSPVDLPSFLAEFGHPIPEDGNKIEFALDLMQELEQETGGAKDLVQFNKSRQNTRSNEISDQQRRLPLKEAIRARGNLISGSTNSGGSSFTNPFWKEVMVLSNRSITNSRRLPELFGLRFSATVFTGFIFATLFWQLDNSLTGVRERIGFFAYTSSTIFYICTDTLPVLIQDRYIFMRETANNAYRRSSYWLSDTIVTLPGLIILSLAVSSITFWAVGLAGGIPGFLFYFLVILSSFWTGNSFVSFISGVVPHLILGCIVVLANLAYFTLFSGFFINRDRIPLYWIWFHYISPMKYTYEAFLQNEFEDPVKCFARGIQIFDTTPLETISDPEKTKILESISNLTGVTITSSTCLTTGYNVLHDQSIRDLSKWNCLWVMMAVGFLFRILFYFSLLIGSKNKRR